MWKSTHAHSSLIVPRANYRSLSHGTHQSSHEPCRYITTSAQRMNDEALAAVSRSRAPPAQKSCCCRCASGRDGPFAPVKICNYHGICAGDETLQCRQRRSSAAAAGCVMQHIRNSPPRDTFACLCLRARRICRRSFAPPATDPTIRTKQSSCSRAPPASRSWAASCGWRAG